MDLDTLHRKLRATSTYPSGAGPLQGAMLDLVGKVGTAAIRINQVHRRDGGIMQPQRKAMIHEDLGEILRHLIGVCEEAGTSLGEVAKVSLRKMQLKKMSEETGNNGR